MAAAQWGQQQQAAQQWGGQQQAAGGWGQQAQGQQAWGQQAAAAAPYGSQKDVTLVVTGCTHATVGGIVRGSFALVGENHGKPAYKKDGQVNGLDVMTYYWDERDGPGFCGWWFGPKVGGDQVWAYHSDKTSALPPQTGWKVPYDGPVDSTFVIQAKPKGQPAAAPQQQQQPQQQQAWGQQAQQQQPQQQQGGWNQQQQGGGGYQQQQQQHNQQEQAKLAQQRQQLEAMKQKQHQDNMKRAEEMRRKQAEEQQGQLAANKARLEQQNQQRAEEQKGKMEAMKKQQAELAEKRQADQKRQQEEMAAKRGEQTAVLSIRRVMQAFRATQPDKYEEAKAKLDEAVAAELEKCGGQKETMTTEIEAAVTQVKERMTKIEEAKKKAEEDKEAENKRRRDLQAKAQELLAELEKLIVKAEESSKGCTEELEALAGEKEMKMPEIEACVSAVEEAGKGANAATQACSEFILKESTNIKNTPPILGEAKNTCVEDLDKLSKRVVEVKKSIGACLVKCNQSKNERIKRAQAKDRYEKGMKSFTKADSDKDGKLSRKEIQAFSKSEYKFTVPADTLDNIQRLLIKDAKGVEKADFHRLKTMIGVAREAALDAKKREARETREKEVAARKEKLQDEIKKAAELITAALEATVKAEKQVLTCAPAQTKDMAAADMVTLADETDKVIEENKTSVTAAKDAVTALSTEVEAELKMFLAQEIKKLQNSMQSLDARIAKSTATSAKFRTDASKKNNAELEKLRVQGLALIFHHQGAKQLMRDDVYTLFDKKKSGKVEEGAFVKFFKTCAMKKNEDGEEADRLSEDNASRLFNYLDSDNKDHLTKEEFMNLIRKFMKVVKASVLTEEISIKSKPTRRLVEGEVLEVLTGPTKETEDAEIERLKVKAMSDDQEGWVTPMGNQGTVYLKEGGNTYKVVKETILTGSFVIGENTKQKDRKLKIGELVEVREWAKKEETSGLMRMKVRVNSDGQIGYVTSLGNTGIVFLESA